MRLNALITDDDAVSPVIGVILMVAITVILAAVIGTFVLGLGEQAQDAAPQASFTFDYEEDGTASGGLLDDSGGNLSITHDGGDQIASDRLTIRDEDGGAVNGSDVWPEDVAAGNTAVVAIDSDDVIRVVWTSDSGGDSATLGRFSGPAA